MERAADQPSPIASSIDAAIAERIFPGAVVLVQQHGRSQHFAAYGTTMYTDCAAQPVTTDTVYDVASLTKVFTATAALRLLDGGELTLDDPVARYLPGLRTQEVRLRHLLTHTSGYDLRLSALRELAPPALRASIYEAMPLRPPGSYVAYTNINSLLLGDVVAQVCDQPLDAAIDELVCQPLELRTTTFCPPDAWRERIAPTEWDHEWRGGLVHGAVHDESAHALMGVAGHAGLFSTAADLASFAQLWLEEGSRNGRQLLRAETVALATRDYTGGLDSALGGPGLCCGLGWMLARPSFMGRAPAGSYGHTGFTGPVMVLVPQRQLAVIVLSNRTYPRRTPPPFRHHSVTRAVVDAALAMVAW